MFPKFIVVREQEDWDAILRRLIYLPLINNLWLIQKIKKRVS
jgi:hypothetical protein